MWKQFWKYAVVFVGAGILGLGGGFAGGLFAYPYIFLADIVAMDARPADSVPVVATGMFIHANPSDPIHHGTGGVTVYQEVVHLEEDFAVGPGPAFHVYLVPGPAVTESADLEGRMFVDLGRLRAFKGSQNYAVPAGVDLASYPNVVIWCERFSVLISPAALSFAGPETAG